MDPLLALKDAVRSQQPITYLNAANETVQSLLDATQIALGSPQHTFSKDIATRFQRPSATGRDYVAHPEDFYALQAVVLAYVARASPTGDYLRLAKDTLGGVPFLSVTDRAPLVEWLEAKAQNLDRLINSEGDSTTPLGSPTTATSSLPTGPLSQSKATSGAISLEKRPYVPDQKDILAVKKIRLGEIELRDRMSVLRGTKMNDFSNVKALIAERVKTASSKAPQAPAAAVSKDPKAQGKKNRNFTPIIIISSSPTALITMYNVRKFLEDSQYETPEEARKRMVAEGNHKLDDVHPIYRKKTLLGAGAGKDGSGAASGNERPTKYFVVDGVEALSKFGTDAWDRVICVMTTGQTWQFKPYKWQDPTQLFHHVKGIHVAWANDPPNPRVKDWNVTDLKIDPNKRHVDKSTVANFWMQLDDWVLMNKPWLPA